jgi:hypothetical protein
VRCAGDGCARAMPNRVERPHEFGAPTEMVATAVCQAFPS